MEDRISRRAALKVLAASAVFGCSPGRGDSSPLEPLVDGRAAGPDYTGDNPVSYLATEQLQDIHGNPAPGRVYAYGVKDDVVHAVGDRQVGGDGYFERIPILEQYSSILLVGVISSSPGAVQNIESFAPLIDFSQDDQFVGPVDFKVLRKDQIPEGFWPGLFTNYLQNLDPVEADGPGVTHAFQFSVKDGVVTEVSGTYLRPLMPELRGQFKLFIPEISFNGLPFANLPEGEYVVDKLASGEIIATIKALGLVRSDVPCRRRYRRSRWLPANWRHDHAASLRQPTPCRPRHAAIPLHAQPVPPQLLRFG